MTTGRINQIAFGNAKPHHTWLRTRFFTFLFPFFQQHSLCFHVDRFLVHTHDKFSARTTEPLATTQDQGRDIRLNRRSIYTLQLSDDATLPRKNNLFFSSPRLPPYNIQKPPRIHTSTPPSKEERALSAPWLFKSRLHLLLTPRDPL